MGPDNFGLAELDDDDAGGEECSNEAASDFGLGGSSFPSSLILLRVNFSLSVSEESSLLESSSSSRLLTSLMIVVISSLL